MMSGKLKKLLRRNKFYLSHQKNPAVLNDRIRKKLAQNGQSPYAVIVTCADSRVIPEHIFAAGLGKLFVIRNAGNVIGDYEIGSVEYATEHLGASIVIVMGHTHCGAVAAAIDGHASGYIKSITDEVKRSMGMERDPRICEKKNAIAGVRRLLESRIIAEFVQNGDIVICPAIYDIETGKVEFIEEF